MSWVTQQISFTVDDRAVLVEAAPWERLSSVLRDRLGLTGTKVGCDAGDCGACTVRLDGDVVCACMVAAAQVEGRKVTTVAGLAATDLAATDLAATDLATTDLAGIAGSLSRLQESFLHYGAAQCGICTPGMLVAAAALLDATPCPSRAEVEEALSGVLCRCTGYQKIVAAVLHAGDPTPAECVPLAGCAVGASIRKLDGMVKVTGKDLFAADEAPEAALVVRVLRSPHHAARFALGDIDAFLAARPGILAVYSAKDVPGENSFGVIPGFVDQPVFAEQVCRFRGEAVALVVGEAAPMADLDLEDLPVSWQELDPLLNPEAAQASTAPPLHAGRPGNVLTEGFVERGDLEQGFAAAVLVVEGNFETPFVEHAYIEPEAGFARRVGDRLEVHACTQAPHMDRDALARIMGMPLDQVRVVPTACGGGFGSKLDISLQPFVALAAWKLGRPARIVYTRPESMQSTTKRHPAEIKLRVGAARDGRLTGFDFVAIFNTGAYASWGPTVANRVPVHASGPYSIPNYSARARAVYTNAPPSGAFRGFGVPQSAIAQEALFDELAEGLGFDRLEFRLINALENGAATVTGQVFKKGVGIRQCLLALRPQWQAALQAAAVFNDSTNAAVNDSASGAGRRRGVGIASCWYGCGNTSLPNPSTIRVGISARGAVMLHQGASDIGQGSNTVITQICADALGLPVQDFQLVGGDTDVTPDAGKTSASRQTYVSGKAAMLSGLALREEILRHANLSSDAKLALENGRLIVDDGQARRSIRLADLPADASGYVFVAEESYDPPTAPLDEKGQGTPYAVFGYGAQIVELEVDVELGKVKLLKLTAAHDVGRAINPVLVEGQIEGGVAQGIGMALMEEYLPGLTENLHDYLIPTFGDMPEIESIIVEDEDAHGPFGAKGLGEHVLIPTAPAILNAIRHATGAKVRRLPATPARVRAAIQRLDETA